MVVELPDGSVVGAALYVGAFRVPVRQGDKAHLHEEDRHLHPVPIRLAWAVTIHKSQGKTFDRVVIDIGRGAFAHGQVYVALSRCTSLAGITLAQKITRAHIRADWRVADFLTRFQYRKAEEEMGDDEKRRVIEDAMKRGLSLEILYLRPDDTRSRRTIRPISIEEMEYKGKAFEGLRLTAVSERGTHLRIDRILEISYAIG